jgi:hypothetical protein
MLRLRALSAIRTSFKIAGSRSGCTGVYTPEELRHALNRPVVKRLTELIQLRNTHPAFDGNLHVEHTDEHAVHLHWRQRESSCSLRVDLATGVLNIYD